MTKTSKILTIVSSVLLLIMAAFHGSGFFFVSEAISESNAPSFLKDIVPVLFAHPSIHLISLAAFGILGIYIGSGSRRLLALLSVVVFADVALAVYLGGIVPAVLLSVAAICFAIASYLSPGTDSR